MGIRGGQQQSSATSVCKTKFADPLVIYQGAHFTRDLHMAFGIPYLYNFITKLCRQQATVVLNYENVNIRNIGQGRLNIETVETVVISFSSI